MCTAKLTESMASMLQKQHHWTNSMKSMLSGFLEECKISDILCVFVSNSTRATVFLTENQEHDKERE